MTKTQLAKNIFVCGFMASGKSTLGKNLSARLKAEYVDLDQFIQNEEGKTINQIFEEKGEAYFREKEREAVYRLIENFNGVISLGGGTLQNQEMVDVIKKNGILLFLETPIEEITERVFRRSHRPILFDKNGKTKPKQILFDELKTLYFERQKYYEQAHICLKRKDFSSKEEVAAAAINKIQLYD